MSRDIPTEGLPFPDRARLALANWLLGGLGPMARIRLRWHLVGERAR